VGAAGGGAASRPVEAVVLGIDPGSPVLVTQGQLTTAEGQLIAYSETATAAGICDSRSYAIA